MIQIDSHFNLSKLSNAFSSGRANNSKTLHCSDCVFVVHRVGDGLSRRSAINEEVSSSNDSNNSSNPFPSSSFHPSRNRANLWVEMDCGVFFRKLKHWPSCSRFVDATQLLLDNSIQSGMHYPNVPNLVTSNWQETYYGSYFYHLLLKEKKKWDANNLFKHTQSIGSSQSPISREEIKDEKGHSLHTHSNLCKAFYKRSGLRDLRRGFLAAVGLVLLNSASKLVRKAVAGLFVNKASH